MNRDNKINNASEYEDHDKWYRDEFKKPLEEIQQDIFFRADNFEHEDWYNEFLIYTKIGVCNPLPEHCSDVQKALKIMGYSTRVAEQNGKTYIVPEKNRSKQHTPKESYER